MIRKWKLLINTFLVVTDGDYYLAVQISTKHDAALLAGSGDAYIAALYNAYHPFHLALVAAFVEWKKESGDKSGKTQNLNHLLSTLSSTKIKDWDIAIQGVYKNHTSKYKSILPHKRGPFQSGKQLDRINAVKALGLILTGETALASTKTDVDNFALQLDNANISQKSGKTTTSVDSTEVEKARVAMCIEMFGNYGALVFHFKTDLDLVGAYFDEEGIRNAQQTHYTGHIKPLTLHKICKRTLHETDEITIYNSGTTILKFYLAQHKNEMPTATAFTLEPGVEQTILASSLGNLAYKQFMVYNTHDVETGEFIIDFR